MKMGSLRRGCGVDISRESSGRIFRFDRQGERLVAKDAVLLAEDVDLFAKAVGVENVLLVAGQSDDILAFPNTVQADSTIEVLAFFIEKGTVGEC